MNVYRYICVLCAAVAFLLQPVSEAAAEPLQQTLQLKAGGYFSSTSSFDPGSGIDLVYSLKPFPYGALDLGVGYYRADQGTTGFLSAIPVTVAVRGIVPLPYVSVYGGGGAGLYYKMLQMGPHSTGATGFTELPPDGSEFSAGYHLNGGIEFQASPTLSLLLEGKYVVVDQGKFEKYAIKHGGSFVYGGFMMSF